MTKIYKSGKYQNLPQVRKCCSRGDSLLRGLVVRAMSVGATVACALMMQSSSASAQQSYYQPVGFQQPVVDPALVTGGEPSSVVVAPAEAPQAVEVAPETSVVESAPQALPVEEPAATPTTGCDCPACQAKEAEKKPAKPPVNPCTTSHKGVFYDNDFKYLDDPNYQGCCFGDSLKNLGRCGNLDIGGQSRLRYHHEVGMGQQAGATRFQDTTNNFVLSRFRLYADAKLSDRVRFYGEGIYADVPTSNDAYVVRGIDRNRGDFLNLFFDLKMNDNNTFRIGRQELLFGNQRLVSPLDWANTRRTFEGVRVISKYDDWKNEAFYTQFVPVSPTAFDQADADQEFYGTYATYSGMENATLEMYYLGLTDKRTATGRTVNTFGSRLNGNRNGMLYELEGMAQTGTVLGTGQDINAYSGTAGIGRKMEDMSWKPTLWVFYDYASGDSPGGDFTGFNSLYPLGHKYLGFIDAVDRTNIAAPNVQLLMSPTKKLNLMAWYHNFTAARADGNIVAFGGTSAQDPTSKDFGNELDLLATYNYDPRTEILMGYSHLWRGDKILDNTDADFFYMQWQKNF